MEGLDRMLDISLPLANKFYTWGWRGSLFGAVLTAVSVGFLYWGTRVRDHDFEKQIADLNAEAADATERAGKLEKDAAEARLEQERLKAVVAWRTIAPNSVSELEKVLSAKPGSVNLRYTDGDPESLFLAIQFSQVLAKANWKIAPGALKLGNALIFGFALPDDNSVDARTLREAFTAGGIQFSPSLPQVNVMSTFNASTLPGAPTLVVGSRSPQLP